LNQLLLYGWTAVNPSGLDSHKEPVNFRFTLVDVPVSPQAHLRVLMAERCALGARELWSVPI